MCSTTPVHRFHPKRDESPQKQKTCVSRRDNRSVSKSKPLSGDRDAARRLKYILLIAAMMSACVVVWPNEVADNNLRGVSNADPPQHNNDVVLPSVDDSMRISGPGVDENYETNLIETRSATDDENEAQQLNNKSTTDDDVSSAMPGTRVQLRHIDPKSLHEIDAAKVDEPFYKRWPKAGLPKFAMKDVNFDVPRDDSICFVHVGKTAGSTVGCYLGFSHHCANTTMLDGVLPMITTHLFHNDVDNCYDDAAYYLFVIRDPVERAKSAFYYNRPDEDCNDMHWEDYEKFYLECPFFTFENMTQNGLTIDGSATDGCKTLASEALKGTGEIAPIHLYYNYQYYLEAIPEHSKLVVIRNEHMVEDWNNLEKQFGGNEDTLTPEGLENNNANKWLGPADMLFTEDSKNIICHNLCNEIKIYQKILQRATNLYRSQVEESLEALKTKCPVEAANEYSCPETMPDISLKVVENRGPDLA